MERSFTSFLIPMILVFGLFLFWQSGDEKDQKQEPQAQAHGVARSVETQKLFDAQPTKSFTEVQDELAESVVHVFGELGEEGFRVVFTRHGAAVRKVSLNDEYMTVTDKVNAQKGEEDVDPATAYYPIVPMYQGSPRTWDYGLVLKDISEVPFKKSIDDGDHHQLWKVEPFKPGDAEVKFTLDMEDGLVLEKVFRYESGRRDLSVILNLRNTKERSKDAPVSYRLRLRGVHLWNPEQEWVLGQNPSYGIGCLVHEGEQSKPIRVNSADAPGKILMTPGGQHDMQFAGTTNRFFGGFLFSGDAPSAQQIEAVGCDNWPRRDYQLGPYKVPAGAVPQLFYQLKLAVPEQGVTTSLHYRLYLGPKSRAVFDESEEYQKFYAVSEEDFVPTCCCSIPGVGWLAQAIVSVLRVFYSIVGNWGVAIIMLTLLVRMLLSPLNFNMQRTMRIHGEKMATLKPQIDRIQKDFKDDPKKLQQEMMRFNKEHKLLSAPLKGCLPILVTMPIWFGLFTGLRVMYDLRGEAFFGWINDLSLPDRLFELGWDLGLFELPHFNLLPVIMVALWLYLQMGTPLPKDPQQRQMMVIMRFMPIMMGVMLFNYASGLMIYMCTSSVWGIVEQKITKRILGPVNPDAAGATQMPML